MFIFVICVDEIIQHDALLHGVTQLCSRLILLLLPTSE